MHFDVLKYLHWTCVVLV